MEEKQFQFLKLKLLSIHYLRWKVFGFNLVLIYRVNFHLSVCDKTYTTIALHINNYIELALEVL